MNEQKVTTAKELRDFARLEPDEAFTFINKNIALWSKLVDSDPFDSADVVEEFEPREAAILTEALSTEHAIKLFSSLRPRAIIDILGFLDIDKASDIFENLDTEDTVNVLERSTEEEASELFGILSKSTRLDIDLSLIHI